MDKAMRGPCRTRSSVEGAAGCAMARGLVSFPHLARCNPAGLDRMVPAPSPTRKYLLGRLSLLCALLAGLVVLVPPAAVSAVAASPHGVALIIGNADYEHREVPEVTFAHRDADAFRRYVVDVLGYDAANVGVADGLFGPRTRAELRAYQKKRGYPETGRLSGEQAEALMALGKEWQAERRRDEQERLERERREAERGEVGPTEGEVFRDCDGTWCPEMVVVPAGSFMMGSPSGEKGRDADEGPVHRVRISEPFAVGVYEVTFEEWEACRRGGGCSHNPDDKGWGRGRRPVINVSWQDAQAYVRWLSRVTGKAYRLLSESEWEYVARAGTTGPFHFGSTITTEQANYGSRGGRTAPVGSFPANAFGLHDVHGNVMERVEDCWHASYRGAPGDGSAWTRGGNCDARVLRGGSWYYGAQYLRSANRYELTAANRFSFAGFRVARTLD